MRINASSGEGCEESWNWIYQNRCIQKKKH